MNNNRLVLIEGPFSTHSGYGGKARDIANAFIALGYDVRLLDTNWGITPRNALRKDKHQDIISRLLPAPTLERRPDIYVKVSIPSEMKRIGDYNILMTSGVETTMISKEWIDTINEHADLVIVPSKFIQQSISGTVYTIKDGSDKVLGSVNVNKPVHVLFEGVDTEVYAPTENKTDISSMLRRDIKETFCFLFVGHWMKGTIGNDRKDVGMLVKTFLETFKNKVEAPALILKTSGGAFSILDREEIMEKITDIRNSIQADRLPNVYVIHGELTDEEMNELYFHPKVKSMVSFTKGEGFGRPLLEFSVTGKPVIASGWSGHIDFLDTNHSILLGGTINPVHESALWDNIIIRDSQWFTVNYNVASAALEDVWKNYKNWNKKSAALSEINREKFSLEAMKDQLRVILDDNVVYKPEVATVQLPKLKKIGKIDNANA